MPTSDIEEWRYSSIDDLDLAKYSINSDQSAVREFDSVMAVSVLEANAKSLIIKTYNGIIDPQFEPPAGISLKSFDPEDIAHDFSGADLFSHLNALLSHPMSLSISATYDSTRPVIVLRYLDAEKATAVFPNFCIKLEPGARAQVVEVLLSPPEAELLAVPMTKIFQEERSTLSYLSLDRRHQTSVPYRSTNRPCRKGQSFCSLPQILPLPRRQHHKCTLYSGNLYPVGHFGKEPSDDQPLHQVRFDPTTLEIVLLILVDRPY